MDQMISTNVPAQLLIGKRASAFTPCVIAARWMNIASGPLKSFVCGSGSGTIGEKVTSSDPFPQSDLRG